MKTKWKVPTYYQIPPSNSNVCAYMSAREQLSKLMNEWTPKSDLLIKKGIVPYIMAFVG